MYWPRVALEQIPRILYKWKVPPPTPHQLPCDKLIKWREGTPLLHWKWRQVCLYRWWDFSTHFEWVVGRKYYKENIIFPSKERPTNLEHLIESCLVKLIYSFCPILFNNFLPFHWSSHVLILEISIGHSMFPL